MPRQSHLSIRLNSEEKAALQRQAALRDMTVGQFFRRVLMGLGGNPGPTEIVCRPAHKAFPPHAREKEMRWLEAHMSRLQVEIPGQWVIVEGDQMISHGPDYLKALAEARAMGVEIPFVERVPERTNGVWMGL